MRACTDVDLFVVTVVFTSPPSGLWSENKNEELTTHLPQLIIVYQHFGIGLITKRCCRGSRRWNICLTQQWFRCVGSEQICQSLGLGWRRKKIQMNSLTEEDSAPFCMWLRLRDSLDVLFLIVCFFDPAAVLQERGGLSCKHESRASTIRRYLFLNHFAAILLLFVAKALKKFHSWDSPTLLHIFTYLYSICHMVKVQVHSATYSKKYW